MSNHYTGLWEQPPAPLEIPEFPLLSDLVCVQKIYFCILNLIDYIIILQRLNVPISHRAHSAFPYVFLGIFCFFRKMHFFTSKIVPTHF